MTPLPTDASGQTIYPVTGPDGLPLATDTTGRFVSPAGDKISTDESGRPLGPDGSVLPTDDSGKYIYPAVGPDGEPLPTDEHQRPIYPVVGPDGRPLPTDTAGNPVGPNREPLPTNAAGQPIAPDGSPLPTDFDGNVVYDPEEVRKAKPLPTDAEGEMIYPVTGPDGLPLATDTSGRFVSPAGDKISTDDSGRPIGPDGSVLPTDDSGKYIYPAVGPDGEPLPTDENRKPIYPVVGPDGALLPTDADGRHVGSDGRPVPTNAAGRPVAPDGSPLPLGDDGNVVYDAEKIKNVKPLPTDSTGHMIYPVTGPDSLPLGTDATGRYVAPDGKEVSTDESGRPIGPDGDVLSTDSYGKYVYPAVGPDESPRPTDAVAVEDEISIPKTLPTDATGKIVHPVVRPDGSPLGTDAAGLFVDSNGDPIDLDDYGRPLGPDGNVLPIDDSGNYVYPATKPDGSILPTDSSGKPIYPVIGADGRPLRTDSEGRPIGHDGEPVPTNAAGRPVAPDGALLPLDKDGNVVYDAAKIKKTTPLPTDASGQTIYPVTGPDGLPLATDSSGHFVTPDGEKIPTDDQGRPLRPDGAVLPTDDSGKYIYPAVGPDGEPLPTDEHQRPIYPVVGPDGQPRPTDASGKPIGPDGAPLPTNAAGKPIAPDGSPLPTDADGNVVYDPEEVRKAKPLPTDAAGEVIYPVTGPDGLPLATDTSGRYVEPDGEEVKIDESGRPLGPDGSVLPTDASGKYIYPAVGPDGEPLPTDENRRPIYPVVGPDGQPLRTDSEGNPLGDDSQPVPTNAAGRPIAPDGSPLPLNIDGNAIYDSEKIMEAKPLPTDETGQLIYPVTSADGSPMPVDHTGHYVGPAGKPVGVDDSGRPLGPDGDVLPTDTSGQYVYPAVGPDGSPLPTDAQGRPVEIADDLTKAKTLPTDVSGKIIHPVVGPDGLPLASDSSGRYLNPEGELVDSDDYGRPLGPDGNVLPTDSSGNYVYPATKPDGSILPTDSSGKPIYPVIGPDGQPLRSESEGRPIGHDGEPVPTNAAGRPVAPDGALLPLDKDGNVVYDAAKIKKMTPLPTDASGQTIYPVTGPDGLPLATDSSGRFVTPDGEKIPTDDQGRPLRPDGAVLPTDDSGKFIYPAIGPDGELLPTDDNSRPIYAVVGPDGHPLATDDEGRAIGPDGSVVPTNAAGRPIAPDGSALPTDADGNVVYDTEAIRKAKPLPTDAAGEMIYPVTGPDGLPLATDTSGRFVSPAGDKISTDESGRPLGPDGSVLPTDDSGKYIYPAVGPDGEPLPTDSSQRPIYPVVGPDGQPLATDSDGKPLGDDGQPLPTNAAGRPIAPDGTPLPTDSQGNVVYDAEKIKDVKPLPTDSTGHMIYPVTGPDSLPLSTDTSGRHVSPEGREIAIDDSGRPLGPDGSVLPTDDSGKYIYPAVGPDGSPLPTDDNSRPIYPVVGPDDHPLPTDADGRAVAPDGEPVPTNAAGRPIAPDGTPLPLDSNGNAVYDPEQIKQAKPLPTDSSGHYIYPVTRPDGGLLPTESTGRYVVPDGGAIPTDQTGRPIGPDGVVLATDDIGRFVYPEIGADGQPIVEDAIRRPDYVIISSDGRPLTINEHGKYVDEAGEPISTNSNGLPVDRKGEILPKDHQGRYVHTKPSEVMAKTLPTDESDSALPIVDSDGQKLPQDDQGRYLDETKTPIPVDAFGRPLGPDGRVLSQDSNGNYVYPKSTDAYGVTPSRSTSDHCYVNAYIELLILTDTSNNVKILDYRVMKELIKSFLIDNFNLRTNKVRVGLIKYGEAVEIPVSLGDYDNQAHLISKISESRRIKGVANLGNALRDAAGEFLISGVSNAPRVVIVFKNGKSSDEILPSARMLRDEVAAKVYVVTVDREQTENLQIVGQDHPERIITLDKWRGHDSGSLGGIADRICEDIPEAAEEETDEAMTWPARPVTPFGQPVQPRECTRIDYQADVMIILDGSDNFADAEFDELKEGISSLVDESFDLAPDVVQVGFVLYSDKVSVPVALGHYEDKLDLLTEISQAKRLGGTPIVLKGLDATRQQYMMKAREGATRVVILVTNGRNRGNAANAAAELREKYNVELFVLAVNPTNDDYSSLSRLVGTEFANERLIKLQNVADLTNSLGHVQKTLCGYVTPAAGYVEKSKTTKRDAEVEFTVTTPPARRTTRAIEHAAMCKDGFRRAYLLNLVIDISARAPYRDFRLVLNHVASFVVQRFDARSHYMTINVIAVDSQGVQYKKANVKPELLESVLDEVQQGDDEVSAKLGLGIDEAVMLSDEHAIKGVNLVTVVVSTDGTSSDDALQPADFAHYDFRHHLISLSVRSPHDTMLKTIAGSKSRVIHLSTWDGENIDDLFGSWLTHAICESVVHPTLVTRSTTMGVTTPVRPRTNKPTIPTPSEPSNVEVTPLSPESLSVSWTCCTNNKADYSILYSPDPQLPKDKWQRIDASCRDSFGKTITGLPTGTDYKVCVVTAQSASNGSVPLRDDSCDHVRLDKDTTTPPDFEPADSEISPCRCVCTNSGNALLQPSCNRDKATTFRPVSTLPPAEEGECPCRLASRRGACPAGYYVMKGQCYDVDECAQQNGGCSHGCVNTPGDFYCACPHGMMRDPNEPKKCISVAGSFDRITELLARYLQANAAAAQSDGNRVMVSGNANRLKATIKSEDDKVLQFEWSLMPKAVKKALKWLF